MARPARPRGFHLGLSLALAALGFAAGPGEAADPPGRPAGGSSYRVTVWTTADGLPQNTVNAILPAPDGELWLATFGGLVRFDGGRFRPRRPAGGADDPSSRVTALFPAAPRGTWILFQGGELVLDRDGARERRVQLPVRPWSAIGFLPAADGSLWVRTTGGAVLRVAGGRPATLTLDRGYSSYRDLALRADGTVLAGDLDQLAIFAPSGALLERLPVPGEVLSLAPTPEGGAWIGHAHGLARLVGVRIEPVALPPLPSPGITAILQDGPSHLWLGTADGLFRVELAAGSPASPRASIVARLAPFPTGIEVRVLARDREGNVWAGSSGAGLAGVFPLPLTHVPVGETVVSTRALAADGAGGAFLGITDCRGLFHLALDPPRAESVALPLAGPREDCVNTLLRDGRGRLWVGSSTRLFRLSGGRWERLLGRPTPREINVLAEGPDGDVWVGWTWGPIVRLGADDRVREEIAAPGRVVTLAVGRDGTLWMGSEGALFSLPAGAAKTGNRWRRYGAREGIPPGDVRDVVFDRDGSLWLASYGGGLVRFAEGRGQRIGLAQGLPDAALSRVLFDGEKRAGEERAWLLSNRGLFAIPKRELLDVAAGRRPAVDALVLGPRQGMPEGNSGSPAGFLAPDGRLWLGTIEGPVVLDRHAWPFNTRPPLLRLEAVHADAAELALGRRLVVPPATSRLRIALSAVAFSGPDRVRIRFRLAGVDQGWVDAGPEAEAVYTRLAPGAYRFEATARNEDGVWMARPLALPLTVQPSWWQTRLCRGLAVLALAAILLGAHVLVVRTVRRRGLARLAELERQRGAEQRAGLLRSALEHAARRLTADELASTLAHEVSQPLTVLVATAHAAERRLARSGQQDGELTALLDQISAQGMRAAEILRKLRGFVRKAGTQRESLDLVRLVRETIPLVRGEVEERGIDLALGLDLADDLAGGWAGGLAGVAVEADRLQVEQILVNLIKNACEALTGRPEPRRIAISCAAAPGMVVVRVEDNGPGLAPEIAPRLFEPFVTSKPHGLGLGLSICRSLAEANGGELAAEPAPGGGLAFLLRLPRADRARGASAP